MFHEAFDNDAEFWHRKQLSIDQIEYAADDVKQTQEVVLLMFIQKT